MNSPTANNAPKILLVSFRWNTLTEAPYLFKQSGCHVDVLCPNDNWAIQNSFYDHWIDSGDSLQSLILRLTNLVKQNIYQEIVIGDDPILWKIYREKITILWHLLPICNPLALPILSKVGFSQHCNTHAIPTPIFSILTNKVDGAQALLKCGLPLVTKENYSAGGEGVKKFTDVPSFEAYLESYPFTEPLLVQSFIEGSLVSVEALFKNGELLEYACSVVLDGDRGPSTKRRYLPKDHQVNLIISKFGKSTLLHGFANIALMQESTTGNYLLFEADPRPNKWVPYGKWFGSDFSRAIKVFLGIEFCKEDPLVQTQDIFEIEHFNSHLAKLLNNQRYVDALLHLLDYDKNIRYTIYDPRLLKARMDFMYRQVIKHRQSLESKFAQPANNTQSYTQTVPVVNPAIFIKNEQNQLQRSDLSTPKADAE